MRYTEVRMARIGHELLADIDKETVDFGPNYDGSEQEPLILPARIPNLLINGSSGIAVGMATNIPPHNINEVIDGCLALLHHSEMTVDDRITSYNVCYTKLLRTAMSTVKANEKVIEPREIRRKLGLNQQQFWSKIGVTQSGGSRYESGRNMPRPVRELLRLVHVEQVDIQRVKKEDVEIIDYLKSEDPDLYKTLKKSAKAKKKAG